MGKNIANERIREYRTVCLQMTREEFAKQSGIELERLIKLEEGKVNAKLTDVIAVSDAFGISSDFLMGKCKLPKPVIRDEAQAKVWDKLENLTQEQLMVLCEILGDKFGIPMDDTKE